MVRKNMKVTGRRTECTDMAVISTLQVLFTLVSGLRVPCMVPVRWCMQMGPLMKVNGAKTKCTVKAVTSTLIKQPGKEFSLTAVTKAKFKRS